MLLTKMSCDGCGRGPNLREWFRGELSHEGYPDWRHPGIIFREAGCPFSYENGAKAQHLFEALWNHPLPDELGFLCPECQELAEQELPAMIAAYREPVRYATASGRERDQPTAYFGQ